MFKQINYLIKFIKGFSFRSIPKTILFNFKYFGLKDAIKFPVHVYHRVELKNTEGEIVINSPLRSGMIAIGFPGMAEFPDKSTGTLWNVTGRVVFEGPVFLGFGMNIDVQDEGELVIGKNTIFVGGSTIRARKRIVFGDDCMCSWECLFMDTDFHPIIDLKDQSVINPDKEVAVGDNVWIGCRCTLLKGAKVGNSCVIGANTVLCKELKGDNRIVGGSPVRVLRENVTWKPRV